MSYKDELEIPIAVKNDLGAFEILRVWIANENQHFCIKSSVWDDPAAWGILLADLAKNIAQAIQQEKGVDSLSTLKRIKAGLSAELDNIDNSIHN